MRTIGILLAVFIAACAGKAPIVVVSPEPLNHAWWLRASFNPSGKSLRGVPVSRIDPNWCAINELEPSIFPSLADVQATNSGVRDANARFALQARISGVDLTLVVAVYKRCDGETGTALVGVAPAREGANQVVLVQPVASPALWATIHDGKDGRIELWWCFQCDNTVTLEWDAKARKFVAVNEGDA